MLQMNLQELGTDLKFWPVESELYLGSERAVLEPGDLICVRSSCFW